jgi:Uma2 family endonuclease
MATTIAAPLTLEEFAQLPGDGVRHEISQGELITMPPPKLLHSRIVRKIFKALEAVLEKSGFGEAVAEAGYVLCREPLTIREPDLSVLSAERIRSTGVDDYAEGAPELAVEVVSPSDSAEDLEVKVEQYLQSGSRQVWIAYPKTKRIYVFRPGTQPMVLDETQTLEGGDLLPGFSMKVADLFSENHVTA